MKPDAMLICNILPEDIDKTPEAKWFSPICPLAREPLRTLALPIKPLVI
jgi:hypothetical protein